MTVSVDGFVAGPRQSLEHPLGEGAEHLHDWVFNPQGEDSAVIVAWQSRPGAYLMGRNMFAPGRGDWDLEWTGWWGEDPPYHRPVFVLTHHPRADLAMAGGTTFNFGHRRDRGCPGASPGGVRRLGRRHCGDASTINQYPCRGAGGRAVPASRADPAGRGRAAVAGVPDLDLTPTQVTGSPRVTHLKYRIG